MNLNPEDVMLEDTQASSGRTLLEERLRQKPVVDEFTKYPSAGAPVDNQEPGAIYSVVMLISLTSIDVSDIIITVSAQPMILSLRGG